MYPKSLKKVIEDFQRLPGIGEKTAERLALFVATNLDKDEVLLFSDHLREMKENLKVCKHCHVISDTDICDICSDPTRDHQTMMVVAESKDVFLMEKMNTYQGRYFVLGGLIDFSRGITDKELNIDSLEHEIKDIKEMIIATNGTVEGEMTAKFLKSLFKDKDFIITRLAYGLPVGADLKYADELTLIKAVENRQTYK